MGFNLRVPNELGINKMETLDNYFFLEIITNKVYWKNFLTFFDTNSHYINNKYKTKFLNIWKHSNLFFTITSQLQLGAKN